jgi:ribosomal protein S18 acetylase RimI-like enzyme
VRDGDEELLFAVYAGTRAEELAQVDWDDTQKESFLRMQFAAQSQHYSSHYPGAEFQIIVLHEEAVGRLYVHRRPDEIRVMDIALLPAFRGRGVGTMLMHELLAEGDRSRCSVSIHVEFFNPARRWYERLGFKPVASNGVYQLMERLPQAASVLESRTNPPVSCIP